MTLTDFLLARIAEDEEAAEGVNRGRWNSRVARLDGDLYALVSRQHPERVLAECEAKRRIVEQHSEWAHVCPSGLNLWSDSEEWIGCRTLAALALPFADHPDYDEEWKP